MEENLDNVFESSCSEEPTDGLLGAPDSQPRETLRQNVDFRWLEPITIIGVRSGERVLVSKVFFMESGDVEGFERSFEEWLQTGEADLSLPLRGFTGFGPVKELAQVYLHSLEPEHVMTIMSRPSVESAASSLQVETEDKVGPTPANLDESNQV